MKSESQFLQSAEAMFECIEDQLEQQTDDVVCLRMGNVLTLELDDGQQVVLNIQSAMKEIWLASRLGGFHFTEKEGVWCDSRSDKTLEQRLEEALLSCGLSVKLS